MQVLDIAYNQVVSCSELSDLILLKELWMNNNKLDSFNDLSNLTTLTSLKTIYAEGNPFCNTNYRRKVMLLFPHISQIDALPVPKFSPYVEDS